jgi:hypothetical protein
MQGYVIPSIRTGIEKRSCLVTNGNRKILVGDYFVLCSDLASGVLAFSLVNTWHRKNGQSLSRKHTSTQLVSHNN